MSCVDSESGGGYYGGAILASAFVMDPFAPRDAQNTSRGWICALSKSPFFDRSGGSKEGKVNCLLDIANQKDI